MQVSRVAAGHPNGLALEVFGDQGAATLGAGATRRVPPDAQRRAGGSPRLPPRDHRPGPPVRRRRTADGCAGGRLGPERRIRLPGTCLPRGSRRLRRSRFVAALRVLRRRSAQHGHTGRRRGLRRSRRGLGQGRTTSRSRWHREVRRLQRDPARSVAARGARRHRRPRSDRHRAELGRLPARGAHPDLRRHPDLRHGPRRLSSASSRAPAWRSPGSTATATRCTPTP